MRPVVVLALLAAPAVMGCWFDATLPAAAHITCRDDADCPAGRECALGLAAPFCVARLRERDAPVITTDVVEATVGAATPLVVTFHVNEELVTAPVATVKPDDVVLPVSGGDGGDWSFVIDTAGLGEGQHVALVTLVDLAGNEAVELVATFTVDQTPPGVVPGSVQFEVTGPPGSIDPHPAVLTVGARATLSFAVDQALAFVPVVVAGGPGTVTFTRTGGVGAEHAYEVVVGPDAAAGTYLVVAELTDVAGNRASVPVDLGPRRFEVGAVVPSPCTARRADGTALCTDADGDGVKGFGPGCAVGEATDCDDTNPLVHPGGLEAMGSGVDGDCDGERAPAPADDAAVFADPAASPLAPGTMADPTGDLQAALDLAAARGAAFVLARAGDFTTRVLALPPDVSLLGGRDLAWAQGTAPTRVHVGPGDSDLVLAPAGTRRQRLAFVDVDGTITCGSGYGAVKLAGPAPLEVLGSSLRFDTTATGCGVALDAQRPTELVGSTVSMLGTGTAGPVLAVDVGAPLRLLGSVVSATDDGGAAPSSIAIALYTHTGAITAVRSRIAARATGAGQTQAFAVQGYPEAGSQIVLLGSVLTADADYPWTLYGTGERLVAVHDTVTATGADPIALSADGDVFLSAVLAVAAGGGPDGIGFSLDRGSVVPIAGPRTLLWSLAVAPCFAVPEGTGEQCHDPAALAAWCAGDPTCGAVEGNAVASTLALDGTAHIAADGAAADRALDVFGRAPPDVDVTPAAVDLDGDCRGAGAADVGADEVP